MTSRTGITRATSPFKVILTRRSVHTQVRGSASPPGIELCALQKSGPRTTRATSSKQERLGDFFPRVWCFFLFQPTYCTSTTCMTSRNHARYILEEGMVPVVLRLRYVMLAEERRKEKRLGRFFTSFRTCILPALRHCLRPRN